MLDKQMAVVDVLGKHASTTRPAEIDQKTYAGSSVRMDLASSFADGFLRGPNSTVADRPARSLPD
jgi:hypothetical protein